VRHHGNGQAHPSPQRRAATGRHRDLWRYPLCDPVNNKYPIDTPGRIRAAWAYIHQPSNRAKYTAAERRTIMSRIKRAAKARRLTLPDPEEFVELMARLRKAKRRT